MYNRYIRNDQGSYTRVQEEEPAASPPLPAGANHPTRSRRIKGHGNRRIRSGRNIMNRRPTKKRRPTRSRPLTAGGTPAPASSPERCASSWTSCTWTMWTPGICCCC